MLVIIYNYTNDARTHERYVHVLNVVGEVTFKTAS